MDEQLEKEAIILRGTKTIAVVGCSREEGKPSHDIPAYMQSVGFRIVPVNPSADTILGEKCYKQIKEIPFKVDLVDVFRPAREALTVTKEAYEAGIQRVWLQLGIYSKEAEDFAMSNGMDFVMDRCIMVEYNKLKDIL